MAMELSISPRTSRIQQRAAVQAASGGFQFVDDLHGANLRRAGDGAAGEAAGDQVQGVLSSASVPVTLLTRWCTLG